MGYRMRIQALAFLLIGLIFLLSSCDSINHEPKQNGNCVEGESNNIRITLNNEDDLFFGNVGNSVTSGKRSYNFDPLTNYEGGKPRSKEKTDGPAKYFICDNAIVIYLPPGGTGEEEAPLESSRSYMIPLDKVYSMSISGSR